MTFEEFEIEYTKWLNYNFPKSETGDQLLGCVEELGELAHSVLKAKQGIRGTPEEHEVKAKDAAGDLLIFLTGFFIRKGWSIQDVLTETWATVKTRDWQKFPRNGRDQ